MQSLQKKYKQNEKQENRISSLKSDYEDQIKQITEENEEEIRSIKKKHQNELERLKKIHQQKIEDEKENLNIDQEISELKSSLNKRKKEIQAQFDREIAEHYLEIQYLDNL